jgi:hypothetical protein
MPIKQIWLRKRSLYVINEHFETKFNGASTNKLVFQEVP